MKISELMDNLEKIKKEAGDLEVRIGYDDIGRFIGYVDIAPEMDSDGEEGEEELCWIMGE